MELSLIQKLVVVLLNLISKTWRFEVKSKLSDRPAIIAFWHGLMLPVWKYFEDKNPTGVVSRSKDGQILSALLEK